MAKLTLKINYDATGGSGAPSSQSKSVTTTASTATISIVLSSTKPTRSGYTFDYWASGGRAYDGGDTYTETISNPNTDATFVVTMKAKWKASNSTWGTTPSTVQMNGSTSYTFNITKATGIDHHTVRFTLGTKSMTYTNVGTSKAVVFPSEWNEELPSATSGSITCSLISYNASGTKVGETVTKTITGSVPTSVVPTLSVSHSFVNDNATIASWGILLQGFSKISFDATASGADGSTITRIAYSGANISTSGTATTATSAIITTAGAKTWTITATDSRGRTATQTVTETVYEYSTPAINSASGSRCDQNGTPNDASGMYVLFQAYYTYSTANNHNTLTQLIEYRESDMYSWTTLLNSYASGSSVVLGNESFALDPTYDVRLTITDSLGNSASTTVFIQSVSGFALGLKNDRARFGGVPEHAGLQIDWDVYLGQRKLMASLWTGSWSSGYIDVDGLSNYSLFIVRMDGQGTQMLCSLYAGYFRGDGGYAASASNEAHYYIAATQVDDRLTMVNCHSIDGSGTRTNRTVIEIIGVI